MEYSLKNHYEILAELYIDKLSKQNPDWSIDWLRKFEFASCSDIPISYDEIRFLVDYNIKLEHYIEYFDLRLEKHEIGKPFMNLINYSIIRGWI